MCISCKNRKSSPQENLTILATADRNVTQYERSQLELLSKSDADARSPPLRLRHDHGSASIRNWVPETMILSPGLIPSSTT